MSNIYESIMTGLAESVEDARSGGERLNRVK